MEVALEVLDRVPLIDGHNDWAHLIRGFYDNKIAQSCFNEKSSLVGHVDIERLLKGRSGGIFLSAYVDCPKDNKANDFSDHVHLEVLRDTLQQIDLVHRLIDKYSDKLALSRTSDDILRIFKNNKIACILSLEGLHQIANSSSVMRMYHGLGVRSISLTHNVNNLYADSSTSTPVHNGLSQAGRDIILEMNRLGMLIDLSHTSAATADQVLDLSTAPVAFTHSSAYGICQHPRNVTDECLDKLRLNNGIIMISFIPELTHRNASGATVAHVVEHIEYIGSRIGYDHVGIGTDFDGMEKSVGGLDDVAQFPTLVAAMISRGIAEEDVEKTIGLNIIRVLAEVERVANESAGQRPKEDDVKQLWTDDIRSYVRRVYPDRE